MKQHQLMPSLYLLRYRFCFFFTLPEYPTNTIYCRFHFGHFNSRLRKKGELELPLISSPSPLARCSLLLCLPMRFLDFVNFSTWYENKRSYKINHLARTPLDSEWLVVDSFDTSLYPLSG